MEVYETEREQIDALKKWWQENGKAVVIGVILGLATLFGWQQWQANTKYAREAGSLEYDMLLSELQTENYLAVKERGARIVSEFQSTPYATLAALALAKVYVDEQDNASARTYLQMAVDKSDQPQIQHVARLRLARLLLAEGQANQALDLVKDVETGGFELAYSELKGDIYSSLQNTEQARHFYQQALDAMEPGMDSTVLQMKLDELGGAEAQS